MPNTLVLHPTNGTFHFGLVPEKTVRGVLIPGAPVVLKRGKHSNKGGFGVRHIWSKHRLEMADRGYETEADVALYVAEIVNPGAPIFCEFAHMRDMRVTVVRTTVGVAILEHKPYGDEPHYSVVTAYAKKHAHGTRIGTIVAPVRPVVEAQKETSAEPSEVLRTS